MGRLGVSHPIAPPSQLHVDKGVSKMIALLSLAYRSGNLCRGKKEEFGD